MIAAKEYIDFLIKNDLSQRQFLFLFLSLFGETKLLLKYKEKFKIFEDIPANKQAFLSSMEFKDLIDKEFIEEKKEKKYEITLKFKIAFGIKNIMFSELLRIYPTFIYIENKRFPTTVIDIEKFSEIYYKSIFGSYKKHQEILNLVLRAKQDNAINLKLENFIKSHYWNILEQEYQINEEYIQENSINTVNIDSDEDTY